MWFLVLLIPGAFSVLGSLFTTTGGSSFMIVAIAVTALNNQKGYKPGEGDFSEKENRGAVELNGDSKHDLSQLMGQLAGMFKEQFAPYTNKRFKFTLSEGKLLRSMLAPLLEALSNSAELLLAWRHDPDNEELFAACEASEVSIQTLLKPVLLFLEQFPSKRVSLV